MTPQRLAAYNRLSELDHLLVYRPGRTQLRCSRWEQLHHERVRLLEVLGWRYNYRSWLCPTDEDRLDRFDDVADALILGALAGLTTYQRHRLIQHGRTPQQDRAELTRIFGPGWSADVLATARRVCGESMDE